MTATTTCPTDSELSAFSLGQLPPDAAERVEKHISECETCCETLLNLASDDTFVDLLQEAKDLDGGVTVLPGDTQSDAPSRGNSVPAPLAAHPRYEIEHLIGRGGMGRVYKARHRMMDRTVALKVINREWVRKTEVIDRFHREVKTAASLDHRNIVTSHDAEQADDLHFLVMEHVDGIDLAQTVKERGPLPIAEACDYIRQAAEGLQYAHERGMVHRDIKPHNLMVTQDNVVKILDFGLASLSPQATPDEPISEDADGNLTIAGAIMGTPDFISPEQAQDAHKVDGRSDIYSLGMTLYYLLSGQAPFGEGSATDKLKLHAEANPSPLAKVRDDVPEDLQKIVDRMTAKDPAERFQSPEEVADALRGIEYGATTPPPQEPDSKRQSSGAFWGAGLLLLLLLIAVVWQLFGEQVARLATGKPKQADVHAPLAELDSYIRSMMASPHDLVFLNVDHIGPDDNYVCFEPIDGGVMMRFPAFEEGFGGSRQGKHATRFKEVAESVSLVVEEKSAVGPDGSVEGVDFHFEVMGNPDIVSNRIMQVLTQTFPVSPSDECRYTYRNLPSGASTVSGEVMKQITAADFVAECDKGKRVYFGEVNDQIYLIPAERREEKQLRRDADVYVTSIGELPPGFAAQLRVTQTDAATATQTQLVAKLNPQLKLDGKTVSGDGVGIPETRTWTFSGQDVGEMNLRLLLAKDGEAKMVQEFRLEDLPTEFTNNVRLDIKDASNANHKRTVDATLHVEMPTHSRASIVNEEQGISIEIEAPFSAGRETPGLHEIAPEQSELLYAEGYWKGDFTHGVSMEEMTEATKDHNAVFLFVTVDWKPLDPAIAQQRKERAAGTGKLTMSNLMERLLSHDEHPLDRLAVLISEAAGIPNDQWERLAQSPTASADNIEGTPLSKALLSLEISEDKPELVNEFRYLGDGPPKPTDLHEAMAVSTTRGYYSVLQPKNLSDLRFDVTSVDAETARLEGDFGFELPGICAGKISYVAEADENAGLKVTEFSLPQNGIAIRLADDGTWQRVAAPASPESPQDLVAGLKNASGNEVAMIAEAVCKAAGVPNEQWRMLMKNPNPSETIEGEPLSIAMPSEFMADSDGRPPKMSDLHGAMALSTARGYYSMLQPQYMTDLSYKVEANGEDAAKLSGQVHFNGLGLYAGKVNFAANVGSTHLEVDVTEFTVPDLGFVLRKGDDGLWAKSNVDPTTSSDFADDYDFSQVPSGALEVYGFSPRRLAQGATYKRLLEKISQSPLPFAASFDEQLEQVLWAKLPDGLSTSNPMIGILTVHDGTSLDFALKMSGDENLTAEDFDVEEDEFTWELFSDSPVTRDGSSSYLLVSEKTLLIGDSESLKLHQKLCAQPRDEDFLAASSRLNKVDHQVFALAKSMDQAHLSQIVASSGMPALRYLVMQYLPILTDSSYIGVTVSLNEQPRLEVVSRLAATSKQPGVTSAMKNLVSTLGTSANALPTARERVSNAGTPQLTPGAKAALSSALWNAKVTEPSKTESRLTISLVDVEPQLRPYIDELLNHVASREDLYDAASKNNLQQLALSFHIFADERGFLPSMKTILPDAKHPVSWRVAVLPYIGEEHLYNQYNFDEPWDSENNRKLLQETPRIFRHPSQKQDNGNTNYVVFAGENTATGDGLESIKLSDITDGTSQTILLAETPASIPWTKPEDPIFDATNPLAKLRSIYPKGFHAALADGSVQLIRAELGKEILKALITRNGGERIPADVFQANAAAKNLGAMAEVTAAPTVSEPIESKEVPAAGNKKILPDGKHLEKSFATLFDRGNTGGSNSTIINELDTLEGLWAELDWKNRNGRYAVGVQLHSFEHDSIMIYGVPSAKDDEQPLVAVWREGNGKKLTRQRQSSPLSDLDEAFKLLSTFNEKHGGLESLADWYDVEPHIFRIQAKPEEQSPVN